MTENCQCCGFVLCRSQGTTSMCSHIQCMLPACTCGPWCFTTMKTLQTGPCGSARHEVLQNIESRLQVWQCSRLTVTSVSGNV